MLNCDVTITLVKFNGTAYSCTAVDGVSWFDKTQIKTENAGLVFANVTKIRIPSGKVPAVLPEVGDHVFKGTLTTGVTISKPSDLAAHNPRKIMSVGDNRRGNLPHVMVICQ